MTKTPKVISDLVADGNHLDRLISKIDESKWALDTPSPGWTIAHQIAHLAATFKLAGLAASNPAQFAAVVSTFSPDFNTNVDAAMAGYLAESPAVLLARWRAERSAAIKALSALPPDQLVPWLVRPLPAAVLAAAGMMELFGHGQDVADALGVRRRYSDRIGHLVEFGVRTWDFGYQARGLPTPDEEFRFELTAPSGNRWEFGPADAKQRIEGRAADFCLLITRRRHRDDLSMTASGAAAEEWLDLAQAYRGPSGPGRSAGQFARRR